MVWALIAGLAVWGYVVLSRVTLPDDLFDEAPAVLAAEFEALAAEVAAPVVAVKPVVVAAPAGGLKAMPATIPEFPFPDDLPAVTLPEEPAAAAFAGIPAEAIPDIAAIGESEAATEEVASVDVAGEAPPIPAPARPQAPQAVEETVLYVAADALNVRAVPSTDGAVLQKLRLGFAVTPQQRADDWIGFQLKNGSTGWLRTDFLSTTKPDPAPLAVAAERPAGGEPLNLM
jgi:hypothetical protein